MCGLVGVAAKTGRPADRIASALAALGHRGPDGQGVYDQDGVAFGHTGYRLSILRAALSLYGLRAAVLHWWQMERFITTLS